jgi:Bacteriophage holin of superfamily 6 (Holin_LLH)
MEFLLPTTLLGWALLALTILPIALTAMGFKPAVAYLKDHVHGKAFDALRKWAFTYVAALAQDPTLKGLASEEKKQQAVIWLVYRAEQLGITLTEFEASNLVEEAVVLVKKITLPHLEDALEVPTIEG